jgi:two-component system probable response regulator PhcQ
VSEARHTVLLVDDERKVLDALVRTLRGEGYRVLTAEDPLEALAILDAGGVDLLVSDIDMPNLDGVELVRRVRVSHPEVVRMLLTGDASLESAMQAINDGEVHRYLTKPWRAAELRATLRTALDRLDELRAAAAASHRTSAREQLLSELEREHPGIRSVALDDGVYRLDAARLADLAARLPATVARAIFAASDKEPHGTQH